MTAGLLLLALAQVVGLVCLAGYVHARLALFQRRMLQDELDCLRRAHAQDVAMDELLLQLGNRRVEVEVEQ